MKGVEGNKTPIYPLDHLSFSTIYWKLSECKYKFYRSKMTDEAIQRESTDAMKKGKAGHRLLELAIRMKAAGQLTKDILILENMTFEKPLNNHMIQHIYDFVVNNKLNGLVEKVIRSTFEGIKIISIADFIEGDIEGGEHTIYDWKFNQKNDPINPVNVLQLIFYHIALKNADDASLRPKIMKPSFNGKIVSFVERVQKEQLDIYPHKFKFSQEDVDFVENDLREQIQYFKMLRDSNIWPRERGRYCSSCQFREECNGFHREIE